MSRSEWFPIPRRTRDEWMAWAAALYQVAGSLTLAPDHLTEGQRNRLRELLLDCLSDPFRASADGIAAKAELAVEP